MSERKSQTIIVDDDVRIVRASEVVAWLNENGGGVRAAAAHFGPCPATISRVLRRGGYRITAKRPWESV